MLVSLSCQKPEAVRTVEGATDAAAFRGYVSKIPEPTLKPGVVLVVDNLGSHELDSVRTNIEASREALSTCSSTRSITCPSTILVQI